MHDIWHLYNKQFKHKRGKVMCILMLDACQCWVQGWWGILAWIGTEWRWVWVVAFVASTWPLHQSDVILHDEECEWLHCWLQLVKYQLAMVPNGGMCGWLHLWHQHGRGILTFYPHYHVWVNVIYWWAVKSENFLIHYKRDYYYRRGIVWGIQL